MKALLNSVALLTISSIKGEDVQSTCWLEKGKSGQIREKECTLRNETELSLQTGVHYSLAMVLANAVIALGILQGLGRVLSPSPNKFPNSAPFPLPIMTRAIVFPSPDAHRDTLPHIIVSLTTSPRRLPKIEPVLQSLMANSLPPSQIVLNLPRLFKRDGSTFDFTSLPNFLKGNSLVLVNPCEDVGPATKLLPTLKLVTDPDAIIITVDDDIYYRPDYLEGLWQKSLERPDDVITGQTYLDGHLLEGFSGVLYRRRFWEGDLEHLESWLGVAPRPCYLADDLVLSNHLLKRGIRITRCNQPGRCWVRPLEYGLEEDALHMGANGTSPGNLFNYRDCAIHLRSHGLLHDEFPERIFYPCH